MCLYPSRGISGFISRVGLIMRYQEDEVERREHQAFPWAPQCRPIVWETSVSVL